MGGDGVKRPLILLLQTIYKLCQMLIITLKNGDKVISDKYSSKSTSMSNQNVIVAPNIICYEK